MHRGLLLRQVFVVGFHCNILCVVCVCCMQTHTSCMCVCIHICFACAHTHIYIYICKIKIMYVCLYLCVFLAFELGARFAMPFPQCSGTP